VCMHVCVCVDNV